MSQFRISGSNLDGDDDISIENIDVDDTIDDQSWTIPLSNLEKQFFPSSEAGNSILSTDYLPRRKKHSRSSRRQPRRRQHTKDVRKSLAPAGAEPQPSENIGSLSERSKPMQHRRLFHQDLKFKQINGSVDGIEAVSLEDSRRSPVVSHSTGSHSDDVTISQEAAPKVTYFFNVKCQWDHVVER